VEPLFAEPKDWRSLRHLRRRRLAKVNIEAQLIAAEQNFERLLNKCGWGRRPWPNESADVVLPAPSLAPAVSG
jgi:hypothetical protein